MTLEEKYNELKKALSNIGIVVAKEDQKIYMQKTNDRRYKAAYFNYTEEQIDELLNDINKIKF